MEKPKKKPAPQPYTLELPTLGDLRLEGEEPVVESKNTSSHKKDVNPDLIHRLINCVKKM